MNLETSAPISFAAQIKPLFRSFDRQSMLSRLDLWLYSDVKAWAECIYEQVAEGNMPCDNPWPQESIDLFAAWMHDGMAE
jgi:hypothetical protein